MHLKNIPPALVPTKYIRELESLSKAALMDMVWDLAMQCVNIEDNDDTEQVITKFRQNWEAVKMAREHAYPPRNGVGRNH